MSIIRWLAEKLTCLSSPTEGQSENTSAIKKRWADRARSEDSLADDERELSADSSANGENAIVIARKVISDEMLIAFFRALEDEPDQDILAVELVNKKSTKGRSWRTFSTPLMVTDSFCPWIDSQIANSKSNLVVLQDQRQAMEGRGW